MSDRRVMQCKKSVNGDIRSLCNHGEHWSPKWKKEAVWEIENGIHSYYILINNQKIEIKVENGSTDKKLITDPARTTRNKLNELPDC